MRHSIRRLLYTLILAVSVNAAVAAPALSVLGKDFAFPNRIEGLPARLSNFTDLQINFFTTNDGVRLSYWEAGSGKPLVIIPGWSASGAEFSILPPENATGNFTKIVRRVPVKIRFDADNALQLLKPGLSCVVKVRVR